jgi:serine/threonine-protein kinase
MARVYLARSFGASGFETQVALKVLRPEYRGVGEYERLLIDEARLGARLRHRNLVAVTDFGVDDGAYFAVMEHVDGADLATALRAARPPLELALLIAEEVAIGLEYVHACADGRGRPLGLVHRDVSPSNILISRAGEVKLADFGIAKATALTERTLTNIRKGKYAYMSPEQIAGDALTASSDQFGLGVTLVEILAGRRPFDGDSVVATMENIKAAAAPAWLADLPADLEPIARRCLARDPAARYATMPALVRDLALARRARPLVTPAGLGAWLTAALARPRS